MKCINWDVRRHPIGPSIWVTVLAMIGALHPVGAGCAVGAAAKASGFDEVVSHYTRCGYFQGVVLVAQHGQVVYAKGVGEANLQTHKPNTPRTRFGIASITKQFTAALVLQQVNRGRIRLDGTVSEYLPWYRKDTGQRITVEQLLHHTSGLPADYDSPEFCDTPEAARHYEPKEFAEKFCQPTLAADPGTKWAYSNCGYVLLGLILERVTGKTFEDLVEEQLLGPLGMKDTGLNHNDLAEKGGASGYTRHAGPRYTPGPYLDQTHIFSAGAMYSTAEDLLRWNQALSTTNFFAEDIRRAMFTPDKGDWADGWFVTRIPNGTPGAGSQLAEMRGDMTGNFFTWVLRYPDQEAVIIVLRNGYGSTENLEQNLQAVLFDQPPHLPSRSPKDVLAHFGQGMWRLATQHMMVIGFTMSIAALSILMTKRIRGFEYVFAQMPGVENPRNRPAVHEAKATARSWASILRLR
jgi:CubicO group peptidase (beta-lactamase class C family)